MPACAPFTEANNPDSGSCVPAIRRITCDGPSVPAGECGGAFSIIHSPDSPQVFGVLSALYDQNCSPLTDQFSLEITGIL